MLHHLVERFNHLPTAVILILAFVAYATGAVTTRRMSASRCSPVVYPVEVFFVACALVMIRLLRQPPYPAGYLACWILVMTVCGALIARATLVVEGRATAGTREFEDSHGSGPSSAWQRWLSYSRAIIDHEIRLVLVACYLVIIGPFAVAFRLMREEPAGDITSTWIPRTESPSLGSARRPF